MWTAGPYRRRRCAARCTRLGLKRDLVAALDEGDQLFLECQPIVRGETPPQR